MTTTQTIYGRRFETVTQTTNHNGREITEQTYYIDGRRVPRRTYTANLLKSMADELHAKAWPSNGK